MGAYLEPSRCGLWLGKDPQRETDFGQDFLHAYQGGYVDRYTRVHVPEGECSYFDGIVHGYRSFLDNLRALSDTPGDPSAPGADKFLSARPTLRVALGNLELDVELEDY